LTKKREEWREQQKNAKKVEERPVEEDQDELPRIEPITYQITETKTKTEHHDLRAEQDKGKSGSRAERKKLDRRNTPPGPGQYILPSDVIVFLEYSLIIRLKELHLDHIRL